MTVKELITALKEIPEDTEILISDGGGDLADIEDYYLYGEMCKLKSGRWFYYKDGWERYAHDLDIEDDDEAIEQFENERWVDVFVVSGQW